MFMQQVNQWLESSYIHIPFYLNNSCSLTVELLGAINQTKFLINQREQKEKQRDIAKSEYFSDFYFCKMLKHNKYK